MQLWPGAILEAAKQYGVSLENSEYWLLDIVKAALTSEVPAPWRAERQEEGVPFHYINEECGSILYEAPVYKSSVRHTCITFFDEQMSFRRKHAYLCQFGVQHSRLACQKMLRCNHQNIR
jgi:hypothetical protein